MNQIAGTIAAVETHGSVALVDVAAGRLQLSATLLGNPGQLAAWVTGREVTVLFKETEVAIAKNLQGEISLRNRIPGRILDIETGKILTRIVIVVEGLTNEVANGVMISSVITSRSTHRLRLAIGDQVEALIKSNEMTIQLVTEREELL
ncbi:TOBE domain-containing protein [Undibacterium sp. RuRC25W]|uniref:TOBE domain-containing protein n=1 Tax=Undibacterium sp. RuRC25W TaxID=3413047 RepID=UPI003BF09F1D